MTRLILERYTESKVFVVWISDRVLRIASCIIRGSFFMSDDNSETANYVCFERLAALTAPSKGSAITTSYISTSQRER